ncbi:MAG: ABC transporter substrate-binding protein [Defluviitaleaceae bacterium]|nr:ABC transporter substrate-binding protein [Defluviitaleaceae bacterium]
MTKRLLMLLSMLILAVAVMAACGGNNDNDDTAGDTGTQQETTTNEPATTQNEPTDQATTGGAQDTIIVLKAGQLVSMDPPMSNDQPSAEFNRMVYSRLFDQDYNTFEPIGSLAVNWNMPDATTVEIEIRQGVTFHNGAPLTAHDVAFSLTRAGASTQAVPILGMIDFAEAINDYNVVIHLEIPFAPILRHLAHPAASIVPMDVVLELGDEEFAQNPIGSGPFMFEELIIGDRVVMTRFDDYWGTLPAFTTLIYRTVPDASTRLIEVAAGNADIALAVAPADVAGAEADPDVTLMRRMGLGTDFIWFNTQQPYLNNPLVRQAINYAFDAVMVVETVFMGLGNPVSNPVPPIAWGYAPQAPFTTSLDRARELLAEAGYPDGFATTMAFNAENAQRGQISEMLQFTLAQIGIEVELVSLEWGAYLNYMDTAEHHMAMIGWTTVTGDADYALWPLFHSTSYGSPGNRAFWSTPELDNLLLLGRMSTDEAERMAIYAEAQAIIRAEAPLIMVRQNEIAVAANPAIRNFVLNPTLSHNYATITFAD